MELEVKCVGKTESIDAAGYSAEITFQHTVNGEPVGVLGNYAAGAAIGTPYSGASQLQSDKNLKLSQDLQYTLSGTFTIKVLAQEEFSNYILGQLYTLSIETVKIAKTTKKKEQE